MALTETPLTIKSALTNTLTTIYTATHRSILTNVYIANDDTSSRTIDLYVVSSGQTAALKDKILPTISILGKDARPLPYGGVLQAGDFIQALSDATNKVIIHLTLTEYY
jgi:hypothetical protein